MRKRGFTLIEILIVIAIISILLSLSVSGYVYIINRSNNTKCNIEINSFNAAISQYHSKYGEFPYDFDNFDGTFDNGNGGKDFGFQLMPELEKIKSTSSSSDNLLKYEIAVANVCLYYALTLSNREKKENASIVDLQNVERKAIGVYPNGEEAYLLIDPWGKPYVYDENFRWKNSTGNNINTANPDPINYVGRNFPTQPNLEKTDFYLWSTKGKKN